ncbi:MAG: tetratricopeptide repeat protein [Verrucomicrobiales bacterium]
MKIDTHTLSRPTRVVSPALLLGCFGICLGAAYFLIPKGDALYHLLLADGDQERVIELVVEDSAAAAQSTPGSGGGEVEQVDYKRLMGLAFDSVGSGALSAEEVERIVSVLEHCDPTSESFVNLRRFAGEIGDRENEHFYNVLARRALAEGDPKLAAEIYSDLAARVDVLTVETVDMMVRAFRYTGQSQPAFESIGRLGKQLGGVDALPAEMREIYVALLLEVDRAGEAFDILSRDFKAAGDDAERLEGLLPTLVEAASYSERGAELPPYYEAYFAALPQNKLSLGELANIGRGELDQSQVAFLGHVKRYAQICEWNDFFDRSFDYYLKAAALGDGASLDRCVDLNEGLMRPADLADVLLHLVPVQGRPDYTLKLAQMLGEDARYDEARGIYTGYIEANPDSARAQLELAALEEESGDLKAAMNWYLAGFELRPDDIKLKIRVASLHIAFGEHEEAFEIYRSFADAEHTESTLESLQMLAEAMGDYVELNRATSLIFVRQESPRAEHYLDLAQTFSLKGDTAAELAVFTRAVYELPESEKIAVAYADVLYRERRFDEAVKLLTRPELQDNMRAMALFIEICGGTDQHLYAANYLPKAIEETFDFPPSVRIELGQIYEETGELGSAQRLYASVPEGGMAWQLLATAKYKTGEFDRAEEYQRRYLKAAIEPDAQDWVFLGDICKNLGKEREATEAYKHSLDILKSELQPRNASL